MAGEYFGPYFPAGYFGDYFGSGDVDPNAMRARVTASGTLSGTLSGDQNAIAATITASGALTGTLTAGGAATQSGVSRLLRSRPTSVWQKSIGRRVPVAVVEAPVEAPLEEQLQERVEAIAAAALPVPVEAPAEPVALPPVPEFDLRLWSLQIGVTVDVAVLVPTWADDLVRAAALRRQAQVDALRREMEAAVAARRRREEEEVVALLSAW